MRLLVWNIGLAFVWATLNASFTLLSIGTGFLLGFVVLSTLSGGRTLSRDGYAWRTWKLLAFCGYFLKELILANLRVAYDVITPAHLMRPAVVAIPLDARTDIEITVLATLITLTPGTLSLDVSPDRKNLFIHAMYVDSDLDNVRRQIKDGMERRLLEVMR